MRRISIARLVALATILLSVLLILWIEFRIPRYAHNSREWLRWKYGVDEQQLCRLAEVLDVECEDISGYGESSFPVNYFQQKFSKIREEKGFVSKADVQAVVVGYEARWLESSNSVFYLFYNTDLCSEHRGDREPLVLEFFYDGPRDKAGRPLSEPWNDNALMLDYWYDVEIWDSGFAATRREMCEQGIGRASE